MRTIKPTKKQQQEIKKIYKQLKTNKTRTEKKQLKDQIKKDILNGLYYCIL